MDQSETVFFENSEQLRAWFEDHGDSKKELWLGYHKMHTGLPSVTWSESVDQALCFGWIDGVRYKINDSSYKIRFTPRRPNSHWSAVNLKKMKELKKAGLLTKTGIQIFKQRKPEYIKNASYEQGKVSLDPLLEQELRKDQNVWNFYDNLAPSYKKASIHWVMSAKQQTTRERRLGVLFKSCSEGKKIPMLRQSHEK